MAREHLWTMERKEEDKRHMLTTERKRGRQIECRGRKEGFLVIFDQETSVNAGKEERRMGGIC